MIGLEDVRAAAGRISGRVARTPSVRSALLSAEIGADLWLKLDNLQAVGSFKERGAANRLALLSEAERRRGVVAVSAGNHAQGVARHAQLLGIDATVVMPRFTPVAKVTRTEAWGARVVLEGEDLAAASAVADALCEREGRLFIHPFDDDAIIAGQGTLALELLEDVPDIDVLVVPIGGGGLIAGTATVAAALRPGTEVIGVQVERYGSLRGFPGAECAVEGGATIAEGIAVGRVGRRPLEIIREQVSRIVTVDEREVEAAILLLAEKAKQVSEGAGAAALAATLRHRELFVGRRVAIPVCGGNIDSRILANTMLRSLLRDGRLLRMILEIPDRPGVLADIATTIGSAGGNIIEVSHQRLFAAPSVQSAELEVMLEARDAAHAAGIVETLRQRYAVRTG